jgi:macrolide transport system ATP-binding/permease protein
MIELIDISRTYQMGKTGVRALRGVSLKIDPGEFVAIMGPSGSGKSTLMHILGFLDRPDGGSYLLNGRDVSRLSDDEAALARNRLVGFVFQQFHLLPFLTALENSALPLVYAGRRSMKEKARVKLEEVGLASREDHRPGEMSGGEQQRVAIARSLVNDPLIIMADEPTGNLDSVSEEEIISLMEKLNRSGKTIVMVTHESDIADRAGRIIRMHDGRIVADEKKSSGERAPVLTPDIVSLDEVLSGGRQIRSKAVFADHFRQAIHAVFSHKFRSLLSMLGILIGVAAVIAMLALGRGASESISDRLASLGTNLLTVRPGSRRVGGVSLGAGEVTRFRLSDAAAMAELDQISKSSPSVSGRARLIYGNKNWDTRVEGAGVDYAEMRASVPTVGRFFTEDEVRKRAKVVVIGRTIARELFGESNPIGAVMKINRINFEVIGVLPEKGSDPWRDRDDTIIIPVTTAMYRLLGEDYVRSIDVEVKSPELMDAAQEALKDLVVKLHHLSPDRRDSFQIRNMAEIQETLEGTTRTMGQLLGGIAAISLLVGGIGIMNIMLVSVTERTREIGLRKAIGARRKDIIIQFLIESVLMTVSGGVAGVILGVLISYTLAELAGWVLRVTLFSVLMASIFSVIVGIVFGLWPARQASRLDPITALRYE